MRSPENWNALYAPPHGPGPKPVRPKAAPSSSERENAQRELLRQAEEPSQSDLRNEPRAEQRVRFRDANDEDVRTQATFLCCPHTCCSAALLE